MRQIEIFFHIKPLLKWAIFALITFPAHVFGHAILVKSQPLADSTLSESPKQIDAWFNDKVGSEYKALAVINSAGKRVDNKDATQETFDQAHLYTTVTDLPPDTYTVRYRVVSMDTHIVTGKFKFTIEKKP